MESHLLHENANLRKLDWDEALVAAIFVLPLDDRNQQFERICREIALDIKDGMSL
jgi:hypothetical protein